jgi:hypothetical protein
MIRSGENLLHHATAKLTQVQRNGPEIQFTGIQPAQDQYVFHHADHAPGIPRNGG